MSRESVLPITIDSTSSNGEYAPLPVGSAVTRENPALSPDVKADVFGRSAATVYGVDPSPARRRAEVDPVSRLRAAYREAPRGVCDLRAAEFRRVAARPRRPRRRPRARADRAPLALTVLSAAG